MMHIYSDDNKSQKLYDGRLMKRLIPYLLPYKKYFIISFFILLLIGIFAIALPYVMKLAIDEYINPSLKLINLEKIPSIAPQFVEAYEHLIVNQEKKKILIKNYHIDKLLPKDFHALKSAHAIESDVYAVYDNTPIIHKLHKKYPTFLIPFGEQYLINHTNFSKIPLQDLALLRARDLKGLRFLAIIFFVILILRFLFSYLQIYLTQYAAMHTMYDVRMKLFAHLQKLPMSFFDKNPIGRLVTRITNDINALTELLGEGLITILQDLVMMLAILIMMLCINYRLALITFTVLPFAGYFIVKFRLGIRRVYRMVRVKLAKINTILSENISGIGTIQIFRQEKKAEEKFRQITGEYLDAENGQLRVFAMFRPLIDVLVHAAIALIIWYGGSQIIADRMSLGVLYVFISYVHRFFDPLHDLSQKFNVMQSSMASLEKIFSLMDEPTEPYLVSNCSPTISRGKIIFDHVWMAYERDEYVLKDISLTIQPGETIAFVGATGGGKTTISKLLTGFYPYQKGTVTIDGHSIHEFNLHELRRTIGVVQQDVFTFSGSVRDNITLFRSQISDKKVEEAAHFVNAASFIEKLPNKYNEDICEHGSLLSAGQRQLIAFARILISNPRIFVLDEATANIDTETELLIQDALRKVMMNRTSIIIAHRLSTIQHADRIVVVHKGRLAEIGTHKDLLKKKGLYYQLYKLQYEEQVKH